MDVSFSSVTLAPIAQTSPASGSADAYVAVGVFVAIIIAGGVALWFLRKRVAIVGEFIQFLWERKLWWMMPVIVVFLVLGLAIIFTATPAAPFIYTLF